MSIAVADQPQLEAALFKDALHGQKIVVTRPQNQAAGLAERIRAIGGVPVWFPTIHIEALEDNAELDAALGRLEQFDLAIFISSNAVACTWVRLPAGWPNGLAAAATGPGTASALTQRGVARVIVPPTQFDSEGLVAELDSLGIAPKNVLIFKGEVGREWLADTLRARGARVECVASYRRVRADTDVGILERLVQAKELAGMVVASSEGGDYLIDMLGANALPWLTDVPVFVPHARIAERMRGHGLKQVVLTAGGDGGLIAGIAAHFARRK